VRQTSHERTLERLLEQHRAELQACRRRLRIEDAPEVGDEIDYSVGNAMRAVGAAVAELSSGTVRGIETALRRLASGRFGYCADCSHKIAAARLKVLPFAERCLDCQAAHDSAPSSETGLFAPLQPLTWARS
jgi:DnaK suppressor protein